MLKNIYRIAMVIITLSIYGKLGYINETLSEVLKALQTIGG